jgi:hypothetical protein
MISMFLFVDDVVFLASSLEILQRQLDALALFCNLQQFTINLGKTKVMIFNGSKNFVDLHLFFIGEEIKITISYTYPGVHFWDPVSAYDCPYNLRLLRAMGP